MSFPLPNHPSLISPDPLGIYSLDEEHVPHIRLLEELIRRANEDLAQIESQTGAIDEPAWMTRFENFLQDIAYSLHGESDLDTTGLKEATLADPYNQGLFRTNLFNSALQLGRLFPNGSILQLSEEHESETFTPAQVDCLLAHMFLGTLQTPPGTTWGRPGFGHYYSGKFVPGGRNTSIPYLNTIVQHFQLDRGYAASMDAQYGSDGFTFHYSSASSMSEPASCTDTAPQLSVTLVEKPTDPSGRPSGTFVLVAANAEPGPGAGGTHEERLVGQSPALAIASLLTPVLPADAAVVTSPFPVHTSWEGHGRDAQCLSSIPVGQRPKRSYVIADALPLDLSHRQSDLLERNVDRETRKLYAAFSGARRIWESRKLPLEQMVIEMPPWGCGAFGGSLKVKMPCMIIAAGLAGLQSENMVLLVPPIHEHDLWKSPSKAPTISELYAQIVGSSNTSKGFSALLLDPLKRALYGSK